RWDREPDARVGAGVRLNLVVEPEHVTRSVEQWPTRVTGVDRRVSLDRALDREVVRRGDAPPDRAHDPFGNGLRQAEWASDRNHRIAHLRAGGVRELDRMELIGWHVDVDHRDVGRRIRAEHLGRDLLAVLERDRYG